MTKKLTLGQAHMIAAEGAPGWQRRLAMGGMGHVIDMYALDEPDLIAEGRAYYVKPGSRSYPEPSAGVKARSVAWMIVILAFLVTVGVCISAGVSPGFLIWVG